MDSGYSGKGDDLPERRIGPRDRRKNEQPERAPENERRSGLVDRRLATEDRWVRIITGSGEYNGTINLNSAPEKVGRVSDFFNITDMAFLRLYNTIVMGRAGKVRFLNIDDVALVIPQDSELPEEYELRRDVGISLKLKSGFGQIMGKTNLMEATRAVDRISDLLNLPGKRWLTVYEASYKGNTLPAAIINLSFVSCVDDCS